MLIGVRDKQGLIGPVSTEPKFYHHQIQKSCSETNLSYFVIALDMNPGLVLLLWETPAWSVYPIITTQNLALSCDIQTSREMANELKD
eukprot:snap_masked-scaffold_69-processed-gene-0.20-mRNA-1 protein AED:1.00 eAED:1.00 QI:0/-1/0/0/-1/1/1/0/87